MVDIGDISKMIEIILYPDTATDFEMSLGDLNNDGNIDVFDVILLIDRIIKA